LSLYNRRVQTLPASPADFGRLHDLGGTGKAQVIMVQLRAGIEDQVELLVLNRTNQLTLTLWLFEETTSQLRLQ
jgi:hypothetical protein